MPEVDRGWREKGGGGTLGYEDFCGPASLVLLLSLVSMAAPAPAPTEEEKLAKGSSDLRFLLTSHGVASATQAELYHNGINSLAFVSGEADLKTVLKDSFGLDC